MVSLVALFEVSPQVPPSIYYFATLNHLYPLGIYAAHYAGTLARAISIIPYPALPMISEFGSGAFIFTDFDRMSAGGRAAITRLVDHLRASGSPVLNHPVDSLQRFALLRTLHDAGVNDFTVHRLDEWHEVKRFPVFIRYGNRHDAPVTDLLPDRGALQRAVADLHVEQTRGLIIVEFGNAPYEDGQYRKYSAFRVGSDIYAQHCYVSDNWWIKQGNGAVNEQEHAEYVRDNPHRDQLAKVFSLAKVDYGRIDYCTVDGRVQVFEINTNPTVISNAGRRSGRDMWSYARMHEDALARLLVDTQETRTPNPLFDPVNQPLNPVLIGRRVLAAGKRVWEDLGQEPAATAETAAA